MRLSLFSTQIVKEAELQKRNKAKQQLLNGFVFPDSRTRYISPREIFED